VVALPDRTAFQGMRQQTVANARNLDSVAIAPPVSVAPPPRPEVDPAIRAPTPVDLYRTASNSYFNRLNSDQNYLSLMQQIQNLSAQLQNYVNNTYAPDLQRLQSLNNQANQYYMQQQQQLQTPQFKPAPPPPRPEVDPEEVRRGQQILQPAPPQILAPPPKPEVDPEEKILGGRPLVSFKPADTTGAKHSGQGLGGQGGLPSVTPVQGSGPQPIVDPIRQPFVPKPPKPEVDPEETIPNNTLVSRPKRKAGMAPGQYSGINTNVRGLMG